MKDLSDKVSKRIPLVLAIAAILFAGFLFTNIFSYQNAKQSMRKSLIESELPLASESVYSMLRLSLNSPLIASLRLANEPFVKDWLTNSSASSEVLHQYLAEVKAQHSAFTAFVASDYTKNYYNSEGKVLKEDASDPYAAWYYRFKASDQPYELNVSFNQNTHKLPTIFVNYRISDNGKFIGVAGLGIELTEIDKRIQTYNKEHLHHVYLLSQKGELITKSNGAELISDNLFNSSKLQPYADNILLRKSTVVQLDKEGMTLLLHTLFIKELNWWLIVEYDEAKSLEALKRVMLTNTFFSLLTIIVTMLLVYWAVRHFNEQLEKMATTDMLTQLENRHFFEHSLRQKLLLRQREKVPVSIIMCDIDHFKQVNDEYGHLVGDNVLKNIAKIMKSAVRESDSICRWGGEEFVILANNCTLEQAWVLAEKLRQQIYDAMIVMLPSGAPLSISAGISAASDQDDSLSLLKRADDALYQAKNDGRNCVREA